MVANRPDLTENQIRGLTVRVFAAALGGELDDLTRSIWRQYNQPENADALARLKTVILARRAAVDRNPE
jgi:hypothetical protein